MDEKSKHVNAQKKPKIKKISQPKKEIETMERQVQEMQEKILQVEEKISRKRKKHDLEETRYSVQRFSPIKKMEPCSLFIIQSHDSLLKNEIVNVQSMYVLHPTRNISRDKIIAFHNSGETLGEYAKEQPWMSLFIKSIIRRDTEKSDDMEMNVVEFFTIYVDSNFFKSQ